MPESPTDPQIDPMEDATILDYAATQRRHDPYAALRYRDYVIFSLGWVLSIIGQQVLDVAVGWEIYVRATKEGHLKPLLALGLIGGVLALPVITLAIPAGALADRFDRRFIVFASMMGAGASALWLAWLAHVHGPLPLMYLCLLCFATASAAGWPARSALLPQIVPADVFANAATWNSSAYQIASMVGPAIGGLILYWSAPAAFVVASILLLAFGFIVLTLTVNQSMQKREPLSFSALIAGIHFVAEHQIILATITLDLFAVLLGGATALLPAFARDILDVGSGGFGILRAAPAIGALLMAIWIAHRPPMQKAGQSMLLAVAGFGLATIAFGVSRNFWFSFTMLLLTGACDNVSVVVRHTLVQMLTPDSMRGRVSAVNNVFIGASNELGGLESGLTGAWLGAVRSVVYGGIGTLLVVGAVTGIWPQVAKFGSLQDARPEE